MTQDEARELLDSMLYPSKEAARNIHANKKLESADNEKLLQIVSELEKLKNRYENGEDNKEEIGKYLDSALADIACMMINYGKERVNVDSKSKTPHKQVLPFLIKQVLFYIAVLCIDLFNVNQEKVWEELNKELKALNFTISRNFFSRMHTTPSRYVAMKNYKQPELPTNYKGQKRDELAVAIKNLVYQAGKYDIFCDIFGGSGAASLAVDRRKEAKYEYNELDKMTQNLFAVIEDDNKYKDLIQGLERLQLDLRGGEKWINSNFNSYVNNHVTLKGQNKIRDNELEILEQRKWTFSMSGAEKIKVMKHFHDSISNLDDDFSVSCAGKSYSKHELLNKIFVDCQKHQADALKNFSDYFHLIAELSSHETLSYDFLLSRYNLKVHNSSYGVSNIGLSYVISQYEQYRAYEYFIYFDCVLNDLDLLPQYDITCAIAKVFMQSFAFYGDAQLTEILRMCADSDEQKNSYGTFLEFVKKDFRSIITKMHDTIKGTICDDSDCIKVIQKYEYKNGNGNGNYKKPIFYSDSPYIATSGYDVKNAKGEKFGFTEGKMEELIEALKNSGDRFIFSCRAVKGSENGAKTDEDLKRGNYDIFGAVYMNFIDIFQYEDDANRQNLWVLAIIKDSEKRKYSFADLISENRIAEIMITNFEIHGFSDPDYPDTRFEVYEFSQVLGELISNANV
ncbi:MAG: hypothetical protein K2H52_11295 [Lachnospiraceae bacterium]|nr:hypothetical protein [Lachnospiraceae bacterium]